MEAPSNGTAAKLGFFTLIVLLVCIWMMIAVVAGCAASEAVVRAAPAEAVDACHLVCARTYLGHARPSDDSWIVYSACRHGCATAHGTP